MKKTKDGRFIDQRIAIPKPLLLTIIDSCKNYNNFNWKKLANYLEVSEHTIKIDYRYRVKTIPKTIFDKLTSHDNNLLNKIKDQITILPAFYGQSYKKEIKPVRLPNTLTNLFAEFYGSMLGDGCIYSDLSGICLSNDSLVDKCYIESYLSNLMFKLFKIKPHIYYSNQSRSLRCIIYNQNLSSFLHGMGFPLGEKKLGNLIILDEFFKNNNLLISCLRGLNDTDGSVSAHPNSKIMLHLSILHKSLLKSSISAFNYLNLPISYSKNAIFLYGADNLKKFFSIIGSSNMKHIFKFNTYIKTNFVPDKKQTEKFFRKNELFDINLPYFYKFK